MNFLLYEAQTANLKIKKKSLSFLFFFFFISSKEFLIKFLQIFLSFTIFEYS